MSIRALIVMLATSVLIIAILASQETSRDLVPGLLEGAVVTAEITVLAALLAVAMAVIAALGKLYGPAPIRWLANIYIEIFRGTSALVQLFWMFFVLPSFNINLEPFTVAVLALGLNIGAYGAEAVRAAITSVARGQWEASTALNMTRFQMLRRVILPQAFVAMIPLWGNLFIELLKSTSLVALMALADLTFRAQQMNQSTMKTIPIFNLVLFIYLAMALVITIVMRFLEKRASRGLARGRTV